MQFTTPQSKRRSATMIIGRIVELVGLHDFKVLFQNGEEKTCKSCKLKIVPNTEIPPTMRPSSKVDVSTVSSRSVHSNPTNESHLSDDEGLDDDLDNVLDDVINQEEDRGSSKSGSE